MVVIILFMKYLLSRKALLVSFVNKQFKIADKCNKDWVISRYCEKAWKMLITTGLWIDMTELLTMCVYIADCKAMSAERVYTLQ